MHSKELSSALERAGRVVVKIGTSNLTGDNMLSERKVAGIVERVIRLKSGGREVIIVSSGAIAAGMSALKLKERPRDVKLLQATAAVGQNELMRVYGKLFSSRRQAIAQILLTYEDFENRKRYLNLRNTVNTLLKMGVIPIINENDTIAVDEIKFGDNDNLSALVAVNLNADLLILVSSAGLHAGDPKKDKNAPLIPLVTELTKDIEECAGKSTALGSGGMKTKLEAARKATEAGITLIITSLGKDALVSEDSTVFKAGAKLSDREHWIRHTSKPAGRLVVDDGARNALAETGCSLLPSGVLKVEGAFKAGDTVSITDKNRVEIGRGLSNYSSAEAEKLKGKKTSEMVKTTGHAGPREIVSRRNMVLNTR
ncbi:MAG: glutamate 5-kinase [Candidatus Altiarchaeota archaeon]|nr:glutamate 5-kinase [Candidatus Altiarchaeota archaeon]